MALNAGKPGNAGNTGNAGGTGKPATAGSSGKLEARVAEARQAFEAGNLDKAERLCVQLRSDYQQRLGQDSWLEFERLMLDLKRAGRNPEREPFMSPTIERMNDELGHLDGFDHGPIPQ